MAIVAGADDGLAAQALGATMLQLRNAHATIGRLEQEASRLVAEATVPVLVSARVDVALAAGAAGVNLPDGDLPAGAARELLGAERLVGCSVHSLQAGVAAAAGGADYLIFGPVFETTTHPGRAALGLEALAELAGAVRVPVLAVGGVGWDRIALCLAAGAAGFAAIRHFQK